MSPRSKRISDALVIQVAAEVATRPGTTSVRLADVAAATGLAPATLVQRFGSLEALVDAIARSLAAQVQDAFAAPAPSHVERTVRALQHLARAGHVRFLMAHPSAAAEYSLELRKQIAYGLAAAVEAGELPHGDVAGQARRLLLSYYGVVTAALLEGEAPAGGIADLAHDVLGDFL